MGVTLWKWRAGVSGGGEEVIQVEAIGEELTERGAATEMAVLAGDGDRDEVVVGDFQWTNREIKRGEMILMLWNTW